MRSLVDPILDVLAPSVLVPFDRRVHGDHSGDFVAQAQATFTASLETQRAHALMRIREVVGHALNHAPLFRERFAAAGLEHAETLSWEGFAALPFLTKDDLRRRGAEVASTAFAPSERIAGATGGTLSSPVPYFLDRESYWRRWGATLAFDRWLGYRPGMRAAYLWGARQDWPPSPGWKARLRSALLTRAHVYPSAPLDDAIMEGFARDLAAWRPALLQAYPTPLAIFADFLRRRGLRPDVGALSCTAEPLLPDQRATIRDSFGVEPTDWYGARECGRIGMECARHDGLHVNAYGLHVEIAPVEGLEDPGLGEIVITDLWNLAFPLIRYRTGDMARLAEAPCACGLASPRLFDIAGRTADTFVNSRGQRVPGVSLTNRLITESGRVHALQLLQHEPRRFEALIVPGPDDDDGTAAWLRERLEGFMGEPLALAVRRVEWIPLEPSGKARLAKNLIAQPPA
jgi:phenylacetate-CoA ligase